MSYHHIPVTAVILAATLLVGIILPMLALTWHAARSGQHSPANLQRDAAEDER